MMQPHTPNTHHRFVPLAVASTPHEAGNDTPTKAQLCQPLQQALLTRNYQPPQPAMAAHLNEVEVWLYKA
jgi:hypothetical protein